MEMSNCTCCKRRLDSCACIHSNFIHKKWRRLTALVAKDDWTPVPASIPTLYRSTSYKTTLHIVYKKWRRLIALVAKNDWTPVPASIPTYKTTLHIEFP